MQVRLSDSVTGSRTGRSAPCICYFADTSKIEERVEEMEERIREGEESVGEGEGNAREGEDSVRLGEECWIRRIE